jgi:hypothetical protein
VETLGEEFGEARSGLGHRVRPGDADEREALPGGSGAKKILQKSRLA